VTDWRAVRAGALADLAVLTPVVAVYAILHGTGTIHGDAGVIVTAVIAVLVAPAVGGAVAATRGPASSPVKHSSLAAGIAVLAYVAFRGIDTVVRNRPLNGPSVVLLVVVSVMFGVIGGLAARNWQTRRS
jgi:hypothetical protein